VNSLRQSESFACPISLREFQAGDERAFARLNQAWIEKYFRLEENDRATLENPRKHILENGGQIFVAIAGTYVTGCVALVRIDNRTYEVVKMAVEEPFQRRGVGGTLMTLQLSGRETMAHVGSGWRPTTFWHPQLSSTNLAGSDTFREKAGSSHRTSVLTLRWNCCSTMRLPVEQSRRRLCQILHHGNPISGETIFGKANGVRYVITKLNRTRTWARQSQD